MADIKDQSRLVAARPAERATQTGAPRRLTRQHFALYRGYLDGVSEAQLHASYGEAGSDVRRTRRLIAALEEISWAENRALVGTTVELLVAAGEGSKDAVRGRMTGRARDGRLVHFTAADGVRPGDVVETVLTQAAPHHLVADGPLLSHRRTRAGDAFNAGTRPTTPGVLLGMPRIGAPV